MEFENESYNLSASNHFNLLTNFCQDIFKSNTLTDVTLVANDMKKIKAHRIILSAFSPILRSIMEDTSETNTTIYLRGMKHQDLELLLEFIYYGETSVQKDKILEFLKLAEDLQIHGLVDNKNDKGEESKPHSDNAIDLEVEDIKRDADEKKGSLDKANKNLGTKEDKKSDINIDEKVVKVDAFPVNEESGKYVNPFEDKEMYTLNEKSVQNETSIEKETSHEKKSQRKKEKDQRKRKNNDETKKTRGKGKSKKCFENSVTLETKIRNECFTADDVVKVEVFPVNHEYESYVNPFFKDKSKETSNLETKDLTPSREDLERHTSSEHHATMSKTKKQALSKLSNYLQFKCPGCPESFDTEFEVLNHHQKSHGMKFPCGLCRFNAPSRETMKTHMEQVHLC